MKNIDEIDKNLAVETSIEREGLKFYDVLHESTMCRVLCRGIMLK